MFFKTNTSVFTEVAYTKIFVKVVNHRANSSFHFPKTGDSDNLLFFCLGAMLLVFTGIIYFRFKMKQKGEKFDEKN
ncbi:LPXTG cell wall anchor domain-containing protein [Enterococcus faecium]|uniref:LPXTG cell wall anchor domain-containing protein n=1 Tax=Enterococcus faecium TaxID=1352 RepID=UPI0019FD875F|nr:LPXTG cell wall anchor domain-containing protein [Enterococcus faecium]